MVLGISEFILFDLPAVVVIVFIIDWIAEETLRAYQVVTVRGWSILSEDFSKHEILSSFSHVKLRLCLLIKADRMKSVLILIHAHVHLLRHLFSPEGINKALVTISFL